MIDNNEDLTRNINIIRRKVKYARITISTNLKIEMIVPLKYPEKDVVSMIQKKSDWIKKQLNYFESRQAARIKPNFGEIILLGKIYKFQLMPELGRKCKINDVLNTIASGRNLLEEETLNKWYKNEAKRILNERLVHFAGLHGFSYNKVSVRGQKTLWGSCSRTGNLSFNWRLIQTPLPILDYIVVHELVHTIIFNHTGTYWGKVGTIYPNYKHANKWLNYFTPGDY